MRYIIVKHAKDMFPDKRASLEYSVYDTYTARKIGIVEQIYTDLEIAERDCRLYNNENSTANYGVVELE